MVLKNSIPTSHFRSRPARWATSVHWEGPPSKASHSRNGWMLKHPNEKSRRQGPQNDGNSEIPGEFLSNMTMFFSIYVKFLDVYTLLKKKLRLFSYQKREASQTGNSSSTFPDLGLKKGETLSMFPGSQVLYVVNDSLKLSKFNIPMAGLRPGFDTQTPGVCHSCCSSSVQRSQKMYAS